MRCPPPSCLLFWVQEELRDFTHLSHSCAPNKECQLPVTADRCVQGIQLCNLSLLALDWNRSATCPCNSTSQFSVFAWWKIGSKNNFRNCSIWKAAQSTWHLWAPTCHTVAAPCACSTGELCVSVLPFPALLRPSSSGFSDLVSSPAALPFGTPSRTWVCPSC